ncbi:F-box domain protein [Aspergillus clavatus NRRL 1]|uniref:F-box domain protein n=1 Tax=Aspergillus clavatus (strain ATCC 1007 / CBS 513.65 / DSM 816 / NCTC 3887 / NRRL 1 / QM 1276 / 107) TaxID=344612 RepID=A1CF48_ASPCL|nr:F-box domain protein [Aspergillus clavatus NRRL 1]EAW11497.1 F-box domain protein [Aspergillus clavatus NRRL 1]
MATTFPDEIAPSPEAISPVSPTSSTGQIPLERPPKLKGRHKLLQNLQRMSSSPSLTRRNRSASAGYRRDGKASLSCVSLGQSAYNPCLGNGSSSQLYGGLGVRPVTPASPGEYHDGNARIRLVGSDSPNGSNTKTIPLPTELRPGSRGSPLEKDTAEESVATPAPKPTFDFWGGMPNEIQMNIFRHLSPKEIIRCSIVSKAWNKMCYDGQLWSCIDTTDYYREIPSDSLVKIITSGGPFVRDLSLRGCIQLRDKWASEGERITDLCRNVVNFSLEGCRIDKTSMHCFLLRNPRLEVINVSGLPTVTNSAMKIIAQACPQLETLNVSWCAGVTTGGLKRVVQACPKLKDLRVSEIHGFDDEEFMVELFKKNTLERLIVSRTDLTDDSLKLLIHGVDPEIDLLTDRPIVPPRRLKHLDLHQCTELTDVGVKSLAHNVPELEGLQLSQCPELSDAAVIHVIRTTPLLTHLELEDLERLTNNSLVELANSPCAERLQHLNISYCESLGDLGMLQVMKTCSSLRSVEMDNTRVSDLTLMEASFRVRKRGYDENLPQIGLRLVVFDCANVTWAGVKEVLSSNAYLPRSRRVNSAKPMVMQQIDESESPDSPTMIPSSITPPPPPSIYPNEIIHLKCFYGWQMTVDEHNKRVLRGDLAAANRLDRKWADYMMATEEAGVGGAGARRRRRRAREAERLYNADDDEDTYGISVLGGRRRRAHSGGCSVSSRFWKPYTYPDAMSSVFKRMSKTHAA